MSSISDRLGVLKSDLLEHTSTDAAVSLAHAETFTIQKAKEYFAANGVNMDSFQSGARGGKALLIKNFPYGTRVEDLRALFESYGTVSNVIMPPVGTIAIVKFQNDDHPRSALKGLAYRKFNGSILYLEKAPENLFDDDSSTPKGMELPNSKAAGVSTTRLYEHENLGSAVDHLSVFVGNLNFSTTTPRLQEVFESLDGFMSCRILKKPDPKKPGHFLSMGFGFVEFRSKSQAAAALSVMDGYSLDGHELSLKISQKNLDAAEQRKLEDQVQKTSEKSAKIIIRNLPFEASKQDIRSLFGAYGQLKSVRLPKKFDNSTRGFAFANFINAKEAQNAMKALSDTHLLGRRLRLEFAAEDFTDPEENISKMQDRIKNQTTKIDLQNLAGPQRQRFNIGLDSLE